ncbi:Poly [ADP-ribose] polymerase 1 [Gonapodya sp. JEL0774]|nr:Poly [ADP-ribose] polymerase 1 [Gonapodya sp. JEL0774]
MTAWFHPSCFSKKAFGKNTKLSEILGVPSLRWEDQQSLGKIFGDGGGGGGGARKPTGGSSGSGRAQDVEESNSALNIAYAPTSRSTCHGCESKIEKGELRMAFKESKGDDARPWLEVDRWLSDVKDVKIFSGWKSIAKPHLDYATACLTGTPPAGPVPSNLSGDNVGPKKKKAKKSMRGSAEEMDDEEAEVGTEEEYALPERKTKARGRAALEEGERKRKRGKPQTNEVQEDQGDVSMDETYVARPTRRAKNADSRMKRDVVKKRDGDEEEESRTETKSDPQPPRRRKRGVTKDGHSTVSYSTVSLPSDEAPHAASKDDVQLPGRRKKAKRVEEDLDAKDNIEMEDDEADKPKRGRGGPRLKKETLHHELGAEDMKESKKRKLKEPSNGKGKLKAEEDAEVAKEEQQDQGLMDPARIQAEALWQVKDKLSSFSLGGRGTVLRCLNALGFSMPTPTETAAKTLFADVLTFGLSGPCPECRSSFLAPNEKGTGYRCPKIHDWGACPFETTHPVFDKKGTETRIGSDLTAILGEELVEKILEVARGVGEVTRVLQSEPKRVKTVASSTSISSPTAFVPRFGATTGEPFRGMTFVLAGGFSRPHGEIASRIKVAGGIVDTNVTEGTTLVVSSRVECNKDESATTAKILRTKELGIEVVGENFIDECIGKKQLLDWRIDGWRIWGGDEDSVRKRKERKEKEEFRPKKLQAMTVKNSTAVDPKSAYTATHHVYRDKQNVPWTVQMVRVDAATGRNSYYVLQILESDGGGRGYVFLKSWGRVGTNIGQIEEDTCDLEWAKSTFAVNFAEKSGNKWLLKPYEAIANRYTVVDVDYGGEKAETVSTKITSDLVDSSSLAKPVAELVALLFDMERMKQTMLSFEIDLSKMPLGKFR